MRGRLIFLVLVWVFLSSVGCLMVQNSSIKLEEDRPAVSSGGCLMAQDSSIKAMLSDHMESVRKDPSRYGAKSILLPPNAIEELKPYLNDADESVRSKARLFVCQSALVSTSTLVRQEGVQELLKHLFDSEGNARSSSLLLYFFDTDYNKEARSLLGKSLERALREYKENPSNTRKHERLTDLILCVGYANAREYADLLAQIKLDYGNVFENLKEQYAQKISYHHASIKNPWLGTPAWYAVLARARLGFKDDLKFCFELVEGYPDAECKVYHIHDESLNTVNQPELLEYYFKALDSTETFPGEGGTEYYRDHVLSSLRNLIGDKDIGEQEAYSIEKIREYVKVKLGGDPKKFHLVDIHKWQVQRLTSEHIREQRELKLQYRVSQNSK